MVYIIGLLSPGVLRFGLNSPVIHFGYLLGRSGGLSKQPNNPYNPSNKHSYPHY